MTKSLPITDLYLTQYGKEKCLPAHDHGPAMRDYYLIHYIFHGKGTFKVGKNTYHLKEGQGFLICPDTITYYQADEAEPWHYYWMGFNGYQADNLLNQANLSRENPIFDTSLHYQLTQQFEQLCNNKMADQRDELESIGQLYLLLSLLACGQTKDEATDSSDKHIKYVSQVVDFIKMNYANKITVAEIASLIGLNRSYLSSIFKKYMNQSIQGYLIQHRIQVAKELLRKKEITIGDIARSVGYSDPLLFSKVFKKVCGISPLNYRKACVHTNK
ncbi:AraC-like DNA-binding protein [Metabacillus malikii]|uniref:AraC-like DNA-binding protein n=1 Tax=Metabacillus malikii TaxID=1504265 RepID=A0ABT9ZEQ9_9BACI|nr:AraC-like DNA-binding protein [Metabacillus malikii]